MGSRWAEAEDETLRALAKDGLHCADIARELGDRSPSGVYARARSLGVALWAACVNRELRELLESGGWLLREDCGGAVGVRWTRADLSGGAFTPVTCERLWALGRIAPTDGRNRIFHGVGV